MSKKDILKIDDSVSYSDEYKHWINSAIARADEIIAGDSLLEEFIIEKWTEIELAKRNYKILADYCEERNWDLKSNAYEQTTKVLSGIPKLDNEVKKALVSTGLNNYIRNKIDHDDSVSLQYVLNRVTALDWTLLDLFYQLNTFLYFAEKR